MSMKDLSLTFVNPICELFVVSGHSTSFYSWNNFYCYPMDFRFFLLFFWHEDGPHISHYNEWFDDIRVKRSRKSNSTGTFHMATSRRNHWTWKESIIFQFLTNFFFSGILLIETYHRRLIAWLSPWKNDLETVEWISIHMTTRRQFYDFSENFPNNNKKTTRQLWDGW